MPPATVHSTRINAANGNTWGTTLFYLPSGYTVHKIIVKENASTTGHGWREGMVYTYYTCKKGVNTSALSAFVEPAGVTITPPGLPSGGQGMNYIWNIGGVLLHSQPRVEVWLCSSPCQSQAP